ncbi:MULTISPECIES: thiolase family protein [unclassified Mycobacterium]|uniref:thiolase family protein n=1 Tax=unclassified Mycobacterium TaxID=2642494 RepID=UPI0029C5FE23|nr:MULTISPECIES: thiolase family protein [unclassified Mycobacterium]
MRHPGKDAVIAGAGISRIGRRTGIPALELTLEAVRAALDDAGLTVDQLDGITSLGDTPPKEVAAALNIEPQFRGGGFDTGGLLSPVMSACLAVREGRARHVLVYRTVQMMGGTIDTKPKSDSPKSDSPKPDSPKPARVKGPNVVMADVEYLLAAHAYSAANWLAMQCRSHMELYGTTKEQLGWVAINARRNAARNPLAVYREPIEMEHYLAARPVSSPFGLLDCDVPVDGSIAVVVSSAEHRSDSPHGAVTIESMGGASGAGSWTGRPDYPKMAATDAATEMWSHTDLGPADVDIAELYDGFTFLTLAWLEALGFCGDGESGPFVEGGHRIAPDGQLPLNTYGGQLSAGRMHGYWVLYEACQQLRGRAGETAIPKRPEVAVVSAGGGPIAGCLLLTC